MSVPKRQFSQIPELTLVTITFQIAFNGALPLNPTHHYSEAVPPNRTFWARPCDATAVCDLKGVTVYTAYIQYSRVDGRGASS